MFDAGYFQTELRSQVSQVGPNAVVKMFLHNGTEYLIRDVVKASPGYVMLNVHPTEQPGAIVAASSSAYSATPASGYHPVAVTYESIANIYFSTTSAAMRPKAGFNP
jgi:hypothetical protein